MSVRASRVPQTDERKSCLVTRAAQEGAGTPCVRYSWRSIVLVVDSAAAKNRRTIAIHTDANANPPKYSGISSNTLSARCIDSCATTVPMNTAARPAAASAAEVAFARYGETYVTSPAASGAWWGGSWTGSEPGYSIIRCEGDKVTWSHESYPWEAHLDPKDTLERKKIADQQADRAEQQRRRDLERVGRKQS